MAGKRRGKAYKGWSIRERGDSWEVSVKVPRQPRREYRTFSGSGAYAAACAWAEQRAATLKLGLDGQAGGVAGPARRLPMEAVAEQMLAEMKAEGLSDGHLLHLRRMLTAWAAVVPDLASPSAESGLLSWYAGLEVAPATFNRLLMQGRRVVNWCRRTKRLPKDCELLAGLRPRKQSRTIKEQFTVAEAQHLLHQVDDHFHPLFAFLIYTGARIGEALAVHWEDIDWAGRVILFRQRAAGTHKTGERVCPLSWELRAILEPRRQASGKVFTLYRGNANRRFDKFLEAYGLKRDGLTPHSTRHTFCGLMTATGQPTALVAQWVGHRGESQTHHYAALAARQHGSVESWGRGDLRFLEGWAVPVDRVEPVLTGAAKARATLRTKRG